MRTMNRLTKTTIPLVAVLSLCNFTANAATVSLDYTLPTPDAAGVLAPTSTTGTVGLNVIGNDFAGSELSRSPWDTTIYEATGKYNAVYGGATATYLYSVDQTEFSLMWGSPDTYNTLEFFNNGGSVFSVVGTAVQPPVSSGFVNVSVTDLVFDKVVFSSADDSFEYAKLSHSPIPIPAAVWLFGSGLLGLVGIARRNKNS